MVLPDTMDPGIRRRRGRTVGVVGGGGVAALLVWVVAELGGLELPEEVAATMGSLATAALQAFYGWLTR